MTQLTLQQAIDLARRHHQAGQLPEAEQLYRQVLAQQPRNAHALHLLGVLAGQVGRHEAAIELISQAIKIAPDNDVFYSNLGEVCLRGGRPNEAIAACRRALALNPNLADAHNNLGNALKNQGQLDGAIAAFRQALSLNPNLVEAHNNLGNVLQAQRQLDPAIAAYRRALALNPRLADAHYNIGVALQTKGQIDEAIAAFRQALTVNPKWAEAHNNLGGAFLAKRLPDKAESAFRQALALNPNWPEGYSNLGNALQAQRQWDEAIAAFRRALALNPNLAEVHNNLGNALLAKGELDEAMAAIHQALALKPDFVAAQTNLGNAYKDKGQLDPALDCYRKAMVLDPKNAAMHSNLCFGLHFHPDYDGGAILAEMRQWAERHERPLAGEIEPPANDPTPDRRLKIGYISCDFREHPVGRCYVPLFANHDHQQLEIICYADVVRQDAVTGRLQSYSDQWHDVAGLSDARLAEKIRADGIDVLVDGTGHAAGGNRLLVFARKPAPVQVTWLGYPGTTGMSSMDYRLTDPYLDPPGQGDEFYSERSIRLPHSCWCYEPIDVMPPVNALPATRAGYVAFGCFNNFAKINAHALRLWIGILSALPASRLMLQCPQGSHRQDVRQMFETAGIAADRLELVAKTASKLEYFEQYHKVDVCLDPMPYNGHTTNFDALWMGVPIVSLRGKTAVGRGGYSILSNLGLADLAASTPEEYLGLATQLANDPSRLIELRRTLRERMKGSPLMDAPRFARDVEAAYREMWRGWCGRPSC